MIYHVWQVFEAEQTRFYIVNLMTKQIQSTWKNYLEAKANCDKLNVMTKKSIKGA